MTILEIRDPDEARRFLAQSLWLQRVGVATAASVRPALTWAVELSAGGEPLPPLGVVSDLGWLLTDRGGNTRISHESHVTPGWSSGLGRRYEDMVLGKFDADRTIARASDALARLRGRDRDRGVAFVIDQVRRRAGFGGVLLSPAVLKAGLQATPQHWLAHGWESLATEGPRPVLSTLYEEMIAAIRDMHDLLGPEDLFELEHGSALAAFGQRVALRQVLQAAARFDARALRERPRRESRHRDIATRIIEEDAYPVGGFSSISTRGSVESLLHSQLAYIEPSERPDLFDIKYARDELLYYARDENQFFRHRRAVVAVLHADLAAARVKDRDLPFQRVILLLSLLTTLHRRLADWLTDEALVVEFLLIRGERPDDEALADERGLLSMLFREEIALGNVVVEAVPESSVTRRCEVHSRRGLCQVLSLSTADRPIPCQGVLSARLLVSQARPALGFGEQPVEIPDTEDDLAAWPFVLDRLLDEWA